MLYAQLCSSIANIAYSNIEANGYFFGAVLNNDLRIASRNSANTNQT